MQVSRGVDTEVWVQGDGWRNQVLHTRCNTKAMRVQEDVDHSRQCLFRSCAFTVGDTTELVGKSSCRIFAREKCLEDIRQISEAAQALLEQTFLVAMILCNHGGFGSRKDKELRVMATKEGAANGRTGATQSIRTTRIADPF